MLPDLADPATGGNSDGGNSADMTPAPAPPSSVWLSSGGGVVVSDDGRAELDYSLGGGGMVLGESSGSGGESLWFGPLCAQVN